MKNYTQGFIVQGIIAIIALVLIATGAYYVSKKEVVAPVSEDTTLDNPEYLTPLQTLEIAQKVNPKECLDFDGIRENGFVTYNVSRKFGNGCPEKDPSADYPILAKIKVDLKTGEAFTSGLDGDWDIYKEKTTPITQATSTVKVKEEPKIIPPAQSLKVLSPNGGAVWKIGETKNISWSMSGISGTAAVQVSLIEGETPINIKSFDIMGSTRSLEYTLPEAGCWTDYCYTLKPGKYKVSVTAYNHLPCLGICAPSNAPDTSKILAKDTSDTYFTISSSTNNLPSVTVTSPNGGEKWEINSHHQIVWKHFNLRPDSKIDLYLTTVYECPSASSVGVYEVVCVPNQLIILDKNINPASDYIWITATDIVNNPIPAGSYKIKVCIAGTDDCDLSDNYFTISSNNIPKITLISPNGGEKWSMGSTQTIKWKTSGDLKNKVSIMIYKHNPECYSGATYICPNPGVSVPIAPPTIADDIPNNGEYTWVVDGPLVYGDSISPGTYTISIVGWPNKENTSAISDVSDAYFTITP